MKRECRLIVLFLLCLGATNTLAQYPRMVQDNWTGVVEAFLDQGDANRVRAELAQRVADAGHDTVMQITLCGPDREHMEESSRYGRGVQQYAKSAAQQARQGSALREPAYDDQEQLIGFTYDILFRAQDSSAPGRVAVSYEANGSRQIVDADAQDPSRYHFEVLRDARGRLVYAASSSIAFDYDANRWTDDVEGWEMSLSYDALGRVVNVSRTTVKNGKVTLRSETAHIYNEAGFVAAIERYRDGDIRSCGSERAPAPEERLANGLFLYRVDRFEYR